MSALDKLLGIVTVGSAVANTTLLYRAVTGLAGILALTVVIALIAGVLLFGGFYAVYLGLVSYGLDRYAAITTVALIGVLTLALLLFLLVMRLRHMQELSRDAMRRNFPDLSRIPKIAEAFLEGLLTPRNRS